LPKTGDWQVWQTVSATVNLSSGTQTLRIISSSPQWNGWNFNWMEIAAGNVTFITARPPIEMNTTNDSFDIYPNPVNDQLTLSVNNMYSGKFTMQLVNMNGSVIKEYNLFKQKGINNYRIQLQQVKAGSYLLQMIMEGKRFTKQFIKQ
ncbi:MAG TPA: T9SS type A sorting domain-containing protein, partial [Flavisolibacter sp.]|nr:T9SS type A sorting domain-containing protein [Flavisolibacter sp.]